MRKLQVSEKGVEDMVIGEDVITTGHNVLNLTAKEGANMEEVVGNEEVKNKISGEEVVRIQEKSLEANTNISRRELIKDGVYKSIGNGESTSIWNDPWIPGVQAGVLTPVYETDWRPKYVCELIDADLNQWDITKLWALFDTNTCQKIMSVPPIGRNRDDIWAWSGEGNGSFSVKSCYRMAMAESWRRNTLTPDCFCVVPESLWKSIWKLPILSRFKVFLWRACLDIIPTIDVLERRGMVINEKCCWCNAEEETCYHVLVECDRLKQVWDAAYFDFKGRRSHVSLLEWMVVEWEEWGRDKRCVFAMTLYFIWEARNGLKFGNEAPNLNSIWRRVERCWDECNAAATMEVRDEVPPANVKWLKPKEPLIKLNVDVALECNGEGAAGGVFRDHEGMCVGAFSCKIPRMEDIAVMEAMGIRKGIEVAQAGGITHLVIESDAKLVVDMLHSSCTHMSRLSSICRCILELCNHFTDCDIRWIPRSCNSSADCMARVALSFSCDKVWPDSVPIWLSETCTDDLI
ncbi:ribonuclease H [Senna tora]|uniref:Ribonuclease H n=1 Tax=Senna tora TaxID=362788 RepID=A0A834X2D5_9FABA|nr:ribonuclease H [Senna tora]